MSTVEDLRVEPVPGSGFVQRLPHRILVMPTGLNSATAHEIRAKVAAVEGDGATVARALASILIASSPVTDAHFCLLADSDRGLVTMVHGMVVVRDSEGTVLFDGTDSPTWVDGYLPEVHSSLEVMLKDAEPVTSSGPWDLADGIVPAGGALLTPRSSEHLEPSQLEDEESTPYPGSSSPVDGDRPQEDGEAAEFELVDFTSIDVLPERPPLPIDSAAGDSPSDESEGELVTGVFCSRGHFNHPTARYCAHCGINMVHLTQKSVKGIRPPLGLLVLDDGATFALDQGYVIGREPEGDASVVSGAARPLKVTDSSNSVSRIHAEIRIDGWDVLVVDRSSSNGTFLHTGDGRWSRLTPDRSQRIEPGHELSIGERRFAFESNVVPAAR